MTACERCWANAYIRAAMFGGSQVDNYKALLSENDAIHGEAKDAVTNDDPNRETT